MPPGQGALSLVGFAGDMASSPISLLPATQDLKLYGGDGVQLQLIVSNGAGQPINLTGTLKAEIRESRVNPAIKATFTTDITDAANGVALVSLTGAQTASLHGSPNPIEKFSGVWDLQWTPQGSEPVTILQGAVESNLDVTRS